MKKTVKAIFKSSNTWPFRNVSFLKSCFCKAAQAVTWRMLLHKHCGKDPAFQHTVFIPLKVVGSRLFNTSVTPDRTSATVSDAASAAGEPTAASSDGISTVGRPPAASSAALDRDRTASDAHASLDESRSTTEHFGKPGKVDGAEEQVGDESLQTPDDTGTSPVPSPECPVAIDDPQAVLEKLLESEALRSCIGRYYFCLVNVCRQRKNGVKSGNRRVKMHFQLKLYFFDKSCERQRCNLRI